MFRRELTLIFAVLVAGCTSDDGPAADDEFGGTGAPEPEGPGPFGPSCDENWYAIDGPQPAPDVPAPDFDHSPEQAPAPQHIEFSGPPPAAPPIVEPPPAEGLPPLTWSEFLAKYARQIPGGWYIEDDLFRTTEQLYADYVGYKLRSEDTSSSTNTLLGWNYDHIDSIWSPPRKIDLTWCVGWIRPAQATDPELHQERYDQMVRAVEEAARAWERVTNVNFIHLRNFDDTTVKSPKGGDCQPGQDGVLFRVRMPVANGCEGPCKGETNSVPSTELDPLWNDPDNPDSLDREMTISASSLATNKESQITARHELGHILGFEHEHYSDGFPECETASTKWRDLTPADPKSVMIYSTCEGAAPKMPRLSPYDRVGAFYRYNWSRRHALMFDPVSQVDELTYDGEGRPGIAWYRTDTAGLDIWTSANGPGAPIGFETSNRCLDGGPPPCEGDTTWVHRLQPSPLFASGAPSDLDMLLWGPGPVLEDLLLNNGGGGFVDAPLQTSGYEYPLVGSFSSGIRDQVIFYTPGPGEDFLWDPSSGAIVPLDYADYAFPLPGRYRGFGGGASDIIWYQPENGTIEVWQWLDFGEDYNFLRQGAADVSRHHVEAGGDYVPLLGDFDGDDRTDIFWYAPGVTTDSLWLSVSNQDVVIFNSFEHQVLGQYQGFVGDFNGDNINDILWYSVLDEAEGSLSGIWYFDDEGNHSSQTFSVHGDYTPIVADLDDDGCSDIMWYDATSPGEPTPIWRCQPEQQDFECDPPQPTPAKSFPIGYGGAF